MAQNLATKYEKQFEAAFAPNSFFEGKVDTKYTFNGAKTINIYSPVTTELVNYSRTGSQRYGETSEMDTVIQTLTLTQDKGFTKALDRGNYTDSMMSISAGTWMSEQIKGVVTPTVEKYAVTRWLRSAGTLGTIAAKPTKTTLIAALAEGVEALTNASVPEDNRFLFLPAEMFKLMKLSSEFLAVQTLGEKALSKGVVGEFMGAKVVSMPNNYFPENCYGLLARKESLLMPRKIASFQTHDNPPGIDGWLMEGRVYYDAFVLGAKSEGVWALVLADKQQAAPSIAHSSASLTITSTGADSIAYTIDGGDPRYVHDALTYSAAISTSGWAAGSYVVRAVAYGSSSTPFTSAVTTQTITIA